MYTVNKSLECLKIRSFASIYHLHYNTRSLHIHVYIYVCVYILKHLRNPWVDFLHSGEDFQQVPQYNLTYFLMSIYRKHLYYYSGSPLFVCLCVSDILRDGWVVLILVWGKDRCYIWLTSLSLFYDLLRKFKMTRCHWLYLLICFNAIDWPFISTSYCQIP